MDITNKLSEMKENCQFLRMLAFKSDYNNEHINEKIVNLEKEIDVIQSEINIESIGNLISNLELINELFKYFFKMVFSGLDIVLVSINNKKLSNITLVFNRIEKYLNKIKFFFDNRTFYKQDVQKVLDLICEMKISYNIDDDVTPSETLDQLMIKTLLKESYNIFDNNNLYYQNLMSEFYDSGRNINKTVSSIYNMLLNMEKNIKHNKLVINC